MFVPSSPRPIISEPGIGQLARAAKKSQLMTIGFNAEQSPVRENVTNKASLNSLRLSVLVPVYNERPVVKASLRRVLALNDDLISSLEVIVVDDQSTDGMWAILERMAEEDHRVVLLRNVRRLGKGAALRKAIARSTGQISTFMTLISNTTLRTSGRCFCLSPRRAQMPFSARAIFPFLTAAVCCTGTLPATRF